MPGEAAPEPDAEGTRAAEVLIGREAWVQALRSELCALADPATAPRELLLWGTDFAEWPLDEPAVLAALSQWLRGAGRRLVWIGHDFEATSRRHPRLARWRRDWTHRIEAWHPLVPVQNEPVGLLLRADRALHLLDNQHWRTRIVTDAPALRAWWEQSDASLQRSEATWPATTLGL